jgi:hypothetical protein
LQTTSPPAAAWSLDSPGVKGASADGDSFGSAVAAGDFNGDGYADLGVGIPDRSVGAQSSAGEVSVLYGSPVGVQAADPDDQLWSQDSPGVQDKAEKDDRFGLALAVGDFNGDGWPDLTVDEPMECFRLACGGAVSVLYGAPTGVQATAPDDQVWSQNSPGVKGEAEGGGQGTRADQFG